MPRLIAASLMLFVAGAAVAQTPGRAPRQDGVEKATDGRDRVICKRFVETGSLVRGYRTCKTKWEWERERDNIRQNSMGAGGCARIGEGGAC